MTANRTSDHYIGRLVADPSITGPDERRRAFMLAEWERNIKVGGKYRTSIMWISMLVKDASLIEGVVKARTKMGCVVVASGKRITTAWTTHDGHQREFVELFVESGDQFFVLDQNSAPEMSMNWECAL